MFAGVPHGASPSQPARLEDLEGQFAFALEGKTFGAGPGSVVYLPKGRAHSHGATAAKARAVVIHTPGGLEKFIAEAGSPAIDLNGSAPALDMAAFERVVEIAKKYHIEVPPAGV